MFCPPGTGLARHVWRKRFPSPAGLDSDTQPSLAPSSLLPALLLCPSSPDLLVQIGAKSQVSAGWDGIRDVFVQPSAASSPGYHLSSLSEKHSKIKAGGSKTRKVREVPTAARALPVQRSWTRQCSVGWHFLVLLCCVFSPGRCPGAGHGILFSWERVIIYNEWFGCLLGECMCMCAIRAGLGEPEPGLEGQSCPHCPVDRDGDGWLPWEQICAMGSLHPEEGGGRSQPQCRHSELHQ